MKLEFLQDDVLAMVVHDLRSPLTSIEGYATLLSTYRLSDAEKKQAVRRIVKSSRWAMSMVNELLDVMVMERGMFSLARRVVHLEGFLREAVEPFEALVCAQNVRLRLHLPQEALFLYIDPARIRQVLQNLVSNALKHMPVTAGEVRVSAHPASEGVVIEVADNGAGIEPSEQKNIFQKFYRSKTEVVSGLGLGLYIARAIVEGHGGGLSVYSEGPGQGSIFYFTLPRFSPSTADPACLGFRSAKEGRPMKMALLRPDSDSSQASQTPSANGNGVFRANGNGQQNGNGHNLGNGNGHGQASSNGHPSGDGQAH